MTSRGDRRALERLIGGAEMSWFVARVRGRVLAADGRPLIGVVQLRDPTDEQRLAAIRLVGRSPRAGVSLRIDLAVAEEVLRRGPWPAGLADAVQTLGGPVIDLAADRARDSNAWHRAREPLAGARHADVLEGWWHDWCSAGGLARAARAEALRLGEEPGPDVARRLVEQVAHVLDHLPGEGLPVAVLARRTLGDAHGLDESRPLGRLATVVVDRAFGSNDSTEPRRSVREIWAAAGVMRSSVASWVLSVGVPGAVPPGGPSGSDLGAATAVTLEAMRSVRAPLLLTLDQVRSGGIAPLGRDLVVHVCENPTVVEVVAARWSEQPPASAGEGDGAPLVVCTWGHPSAAAVELLTILTAGGAPCRYHGDFDWHGLRIATALGARVPWTPWRFGAEDYCDAVGQGRPARALTGSPSEAGWDPGLAPAMAEVGLAVEEEAVVDLLASDVLGIAPSWRTEAISPAAPAASYRTGRGAPGPSWS